MLKRAPISACKYTPGLVEDFTPTDSVPVNRSIIEDYCRFLFPSLRPDWMESKLRNKEIVYARKYLFYLIHTYEVTQPTLREVGRWYFKDHASVIHSIKTLRNIIEVTPAEQKRFNHIIESFLPWVLDKESTDVRVRNKIRELKNQFNDARIKLMPVSPIVGNKKTY